MLLISHIRLIIICACFSISFKSYGQNTSESSFFSKLYFPFDFGVALSNNKTIANGGLIKVGLEYRLNKNKSWFIRLNFDNRNNQFQINQNQTTNTVGGKIKFDDYVIGLGYRIGRKTIKGFGLYQAGISRYTFPTVAGQVNRFEIIEKNNITAISKYTLGLEYYVAKNVALALESSCFVQSTTAVFWGNSFSGFGISMGVTTTLF